MRHILRALPVVAALAASSGVAAGAQSPTCGFVGFSPHSDNGAFGIVAHEATCHTARIVASGSRSTRFRSGDPRYDTLGFTCSGLGGQLGGHGKYVVRFHCVRARSVVSFLRG